MALPWQIPGHAMAIPRGCHGMALVTLRLAAPRDCHGTAMVNPWPCHGYPKGLPWHGPGHFKVSCAKGLPWHCHGQSLAMAMAIPRGCYGMALATLRSAAAKGLPWHCHGQSLATSFRDFLRDSAWTAIQSRPIWLPQLLGHNVISTSA